MHMFDDVFNFNALVQLGGMFLMDRLEIKGSGEKIPKTLKNNKLVTENDNKS